MKTNMDVKLRRVETPQRNICCKNCECRLKAGANSIFKVMLKI